MQSNATKPQAITTEPFYLPLGDEIEVFEAAAHERAPVLLKGMTGTGKTRFIEYMTWKLQRAWSAERGAEVNFPLVTIACHEDLTAGDLVGRFLLDADGTRWSDGPLTRVVRNGGMCYLDEIVEARKDTTVVIHSLTDYRRLLVIDKLAEQVEASPYFMMVISYNPGYQSVQKDMKHSTRQRFVAIELGFPEPEKEATIIAHEAGVDDQLAIQLAKLGELLRRLKGAELEESASTRSLIYAAKLIRKGIAPRRACQVAICLAITDDKAAQAAIDEIIGAVFAE